MAGVLRGGIREHLYAIKYNIRAYEGGMKNEILFSFLVRWYFNFPLPFKHLPHRLEGRRE